MYRDHILLYKDALSSAKLGLVKQIQGLFSTINTILQPPDFFAPHMYSTEHCNTLMSFFNAKIKKSNSQLTSKKQSVPSALYPAFCPPLFSSFSSFQLPTVADISSIIQKSKS